MKQIIFALLLLPAAIATSLTAPAQTLDRTNLPIPEPEKPETDWPAFRSTSSSSVARTINPF